MRTLYFAAVDEGLTIHSGTTTINLALALERCL